MPIQLIEKFTTTKQAERIVQSDFVLKLSSRAWGWLAIGLAVLLILAVPLPDSSAHPAERTFHIQAKRFEYTPSVIQVNPGDRVTIELEAGDVVHGLSIDGYNLNVTADPGQPARLTFIADKSGSYRFRCSVTCGNMHPFMIGKLQVGANTLYWRAAGLVLLALAAGLWGLRL
jgi:heme/copper-type cytochrome/quinol oxidase subunit 2